MCFTFNEKPASNCCYQVPLRYTYVRAFLLLDAVIMFPYTRTCRIQPVRAATSRTLPAVTQRRQQFIYLLAPDIL